ncbi:MAG: efflux RND transporter permease subunit [Microcystis panniformis Mp_MB_F_20051200_S9]|uniref:Efflux RND transporter permease subunit n=1 Tax=Microcystis panniformis Mp_MB_F_20051200_S9 TaxID=2486223 RepID=A0A552PQX6_9CHRO|nr:MAG: efflux RND transporter permease subunit [Microcystis panniformis Mp_MB_F_20080800_S26D]TRV52302.1 MAG: efflux RND transporter permease subunit [Microcystis panniformis Mp_GB_SS_20050300_S99]TRV52764.1 MAG: efflux RND transporter permease subunit [Microcystis panniformis Mp_GB_SS_20050300_S99D]TRV55670.1 MAG: efflux RND transporter permease subunit [Microcystis panniformis Mp_MB_F_20080800_S26]TRV59395.1 MAG: efflux RND transporter permease subunit [Microcystis panniformis Mp_MB_F_200512
MAFNISNWSIKNPIPTILISLVMALMGYIAFLGLGIDRSPNVDIPAVIITVNQPGAGPEELETQVTKKVEDAVAALGNIDQITSTVNEGSSTTTVNFILGTNSDRATNDVRNAIAQIRQDLPQDANDPIVQRLEFAGGSVMNYTISSPKRSIAELSDLVDRQIGRALTGVPGVARVDRVGGVDREVRVDLDPGRLLAYGITATAVNDQIRSFNINLPGGRSEIGGSEQTVRTLGSAETIEDLRNYQISLPNGDTVPLSNLGTVSDSSSDPRQMALLDGQPVVGFSILRGTGSTLVTVETAVRQEIENLKKKLPEDIKFQLIFTRADSIRDSYESLLSDLLIGCLMTVITVGLFLGNWRATIITGLALPLSIFPTFWVMQSLNYTLNGMTLLALALALGNLVDDAVCMVEDIDQHLAMGKKPLQAAFDASKEIGLAVLASAAAIMAVFLPVAFMGGVPGQFFQPFGVTVAVSTLFSSLIAVTVTPMLSAYILQPKKLKTGDNPSSRPRFRPYKSLLTWALRHRILTLLAALVFFIGSLQLVPLIPKGLFSSGDTGLSTISLELPPGATLNDTVAVANQVNRLLQKNPAVANVLAIPGDSGRVNTGLIYVNLVPKEQRSLTQRQFEEQTRRDFQKIPGARVTFRAQGGAGSTKDVAIVLKSENGDILTQTAQKLERQMRALPGFVEVSSGVSLVKPEIIIQPDPVRAADQGVSVRAIARTASLALIGDNEFNLAKFNLADRQIPIRVKIANDGRSEIETLQNLRVPSSNGTLVPLNSVATISLGSGPAEIQRFNRQRQVNIGANLEGVSLGSAVTQIRALPIMKNLPPEVTEEPFGDARIMRDIFARFLGALSLAIISIYGILVLLYNNFLYPLAILTSLPLSIGGTLIALLITQKELGLYALIGIVLLMGLVTKNAILLVDFALSGLQEGKPQFKAVIDSGVSRLRPIIMTSVSTIAGMLPIALALGADGEIRAPMAIAVIGGFTTSTLLTLVVVPVIFTYIDSFYYWFRGLFVKQKPKSI